VTKHETPARAQAKRHYKENLPEASKTRNNLPRFPLKKLHTGAYKANTSEVVVLDASEPGKESFR
jgi:hypothetical protein